MALFKAVGRLLIEGVVVVGFVFRLAALLSNRSTVGPKRQVGLTWLWIACILPT